MVDQPSPKAERLRRQFATVVAIALLLAGLAVLGTFCAKEETGKEKPRAGGAQAPQPTAAPPSFAPFTASLDPKGRLWILDSLNSRLSYSTGAGSPQEAWGGEGEENSSFRHPEGLAIAGNNLYVADTWNHRVTRFTLEGEWKSSVSGLMGPREVAVATDGSVWVTDTGNSRVWKHDAALENGRIVGGPGTGPGEFKGPVGIAAAPSGTVYVADTGNARIQALSKDGEFLREWKVPWFEKTWMVHLEVGPDETVYLSNPDGSEVVSFSRSGAPGRAWKTADSGESLVRPVGLGLDPKQGVLYVADTAANRIAKISLSRTEAR